MQANPAPTLRILTSVCVFLVFFLQKSIAADDDNNITIRRQQEAYSFERSAGNVQVKSVSNTYYRCNAYRTQVPVVEFYDDQSKIDAVDIYVNGDRTRSIKPAYDYYSVDDIFYSDARVCYFKLPLEKKETESNVVFEKTILDPRYFTAVYFNEAYTIAEKQVVFTIPRWMKAELKEMNFAGAGIKKQVSYDSRNDADIYTFTATDLAARKSESMAPGPSLVYPHILVLCRQAQTKDGTVTYFNTLQDQYNWYRFLVKQVDNDKQVLKQKASEITKGISQPEEKVKAIYNWVQDNIRYIAFENGIAGFKPDKAQEVLRKKYGDCKGMANLTRELLAASGFDARLCWLGTNHLAYDYSTPNLAVDNHMICALNWNGKFVFLDATETYIGWQQYAERIQGRQVLIENGEHYILEKIPVMTYAQNTEKEKRVLKIEGEMLKGKVDQSWNGESKEYILEQANSVKKQNLEQAFLSYLAKGRPKYTIQQFRLPDIQNAQGQLQLSYEVSQSNGISRFGDEIYLEPDDQKELSDLTIDTLNRKFSVVFPYKQQILREVRIAIPDGFKTETLPVAISADRPQYAYKLSYAVEGRELVYRKEIIVRQTLLPRTAFFQWNKDIAALTHFYLEQITLGKK